MAHRVNVMLDDELWKELKQVPPGERSRVVNRAIAEWLKARRRTSVARKMDALRGTMPAVSAAEIATWLREDRERGR
jgi:hypothetical protein